MERCYTSHTRYPIGKLLLDVINSSQLAFFEFFPELGLPKGNYSISMLESWLNHGTGNDLLLQKLQSSRFAVDDNLLKLALATTEAILDKERKIAAREKEDEARAKFRPHIDIIATYSGKYWSPSENMRYLWLPQDIAAWSTEKQLAYLKEVVSTHFLTHQKETLWRIVGYKCFFTFDGNPIRLTVWGDVNVEEGSSEK
jgi:hypothetical protein